MLRHICHTKEQPSSNTDLISISRHSSIILNGTTEGRYHWKGAGSLSFKYALQGESRYKIKNRYLLTENSNFIVLNQEQPYEIFIESKLTTETFCVFFGQPLVSDVFNNALKSHDKIIDQNVPPGCPIFFERTHPVTPGVISIINQLKFSISNDQHAELTKELLYSFLFKLITAEYKICPEFDNLRAIKKSTRDELFKRLSIAKDYAHAMYSEAVTLETLAQISCLSPNHLLRSFKQLYGCSPIQYLNIVRFTKAQKLLKFSSLSVQEVCHEVGYASIGTFSNLFKKLTGVTPGTYRNQKR